MKKDLQNIKNLINTFIDEELIIDHTEFIYTHIFFEQLEIYFNKNNTRFSKNMVKNQIRTYLGFKLGIENYISSFQNGLRIYSKFKFKNISILNTSNNININDYNLLKNEINILKTDVTRIISNYLEMVNAYQNVILKLESKVEILEIKYLELSKPIEIVEKVKLSNFIINSLNLKKEKDENYTLDNFCLDFLEYSEDSKFILYSTTVINDYISYTDTSINFNTLTKQLKKYIEKTYSSFEIKYYKDKAYYKGIIYKNKNV